MTGLVNSVHNLGSPMWSPSLSTTGCFVFRRGHGLAAIGKEGPGKAASTCVTLKSQEAINEHCWTHPRSWHIWLSGGFS
jgi:hypothetical protein